jgi:hypothetical protein
MRPVRKVTGWSLKKPTYPGASVGRMIKTGPRVRTAISSRDPTSGRKETTDRLIDSRPELTSDF